MNVPINCDDCGEVIGSKGVTFQAGGIPIPSVSLDNGEYDENLGKFLCYNCIEQYNQAPAGSYGASLE